MTSMCIQYYDTSRFITYHGVKPPQIQNFKNILSKKNACSFFNFQNPRESPHKTQLRRCQLPHGKLITNEILQNRSGDRYSKMTPAVSLTHIYVHNNIYVLKI